MADGARREVGSRAGAVPVAVAMPVPASSACVTIAANIEDVIA